MVNNGNFDNKSNNHIDIAWQSQIWGFSFTLAASKYTFRRDGKPCTYPEDVITFWPAECFRVLKWVVILRNKRLFLISLLTECSLLMTLHCQIEALSSDFFLKAFIVVFLLYFFNKNATFCLFFLDSERHPKCIAEQYVAGCFGSPRVNLMYIESLFFHYQVELGY